MNVKGFLTSRSTCQRRRFAPPLHVNADVSRIGNNSRFVDGNTQWN
jgi:hypothetical protein